MPSRFPGAITQDWDTVVLHKSKPKSQHLRDPKAVNKALRSGAPVQTVKKFDAASNKKASSSALPAVSARKLDKAAEPAVLERVPGEVRQAIQRARLEKKMSQAELTKQIHEPPKVVQEPCSPRWSGSSASSSGARSESDCRCGFAEESSTASEDAAGS
ncbi:hypothetical protein EUGRSUZ_C01062 [Eucalyptus grandis]|uniref:Uncharacterized protein n=2 Tax=Eucalyptus grandis TaxID=71139 RepID=A0ACC3LCL7_EUCGR|nr:hypothetical protein EUGRSUZ_C01062 [Eucalyptus grandis]